MTDAEKVRRILQSHIEQMEKQRKQAAKLLEELSDASAKLATRTILTRLDAENILSQTEMTKLK
jgi:uncharacterized protein YutE (UPF0331/DUF86 family)